MLERTAGPPAGAFGLRPGLTPRSKRKGPRPKRGRGCGRREGFGRIDFRETGSREGFGLCKGPAVRGSGFASMRAIAKGSRADASASRLEGPAAGSVGVRFDRGEPRRGLRVRGSLRGSKVPRCAVSGFASMPGSRRRSLRRVRSPRGRQAVRNGRSRRVRIDRGGRRRFRSSAEPGDGGEARALRSFETGLFEARRRARAGLRVSETGFGHPGLGLARVPQGTAQALAAWTGPAGTGKAASAPPRCPPTQRVMALPRHGRS